MAAVKIGDQVITALKGKITIDSYGTTIKKLTLAQKRGFVQLVPARLIAGKKHLEGAYEQAFSATRRGRAFAKTLGIEFLVRLFGKRQVSDAIKQANFKGKEVAIIVGNYWKRNLAVLKKELGFVEEKFTFGKNKEELMKAYGISARQIETLSDLENALEELVIEKTSLLELEH